jgi:hypothetical protein
MAKFCFVFFFFIKCKCIKDQKIYIAGKPASSDTGWTEREHAPLETETTTTEWKNSIETDNGYERNQKLESS